MEYDKVWLITGIGGQDGSTFADLLLEKGYRNVHGIIRRSAVFNTQNIDHIFDKLTLHHGDLTDQMCIHNIIQKVKPDYICNFAAMSHVAVSDELQRYTIEVNTLGLLSILQSVKSLGLVKTKVYHASTSEEFGNETSGDTLLNEESKRSPVSIYGISKLAAEGICNMYKNGFGMFVVTSTLFNHEGPRRGRTFVTQKICDYVKRYKRNTGNISPLQLGNLNAKRDWGYCKDYMEAVYLMLLSDTPENYVIATKETHTVREFCELAFREIGVSLLWGGSGKSEFAIDKSTGFTMIKVNEKYYRPIDIECLIGDYSKAERILGWKPATSFQELVRLMMK
jgi:GDPmannose 4,6-dehydratase